MSEQRKRATTVHISLSADDLAVVREHAARVGQPLTHYIRAAALKQRAPTHTPELLRGLVDIGRLCGVLQSALQQSDAAALRAVITEALAAARAVGVELRRR